MLVNEMGEFVDDSEPRTVKVRDRDDWRGRAAARIVSGKFKPCDVCGEPFRPRSYRQVYCSWECRMEANRYRARQSARRKREAEKERRREVLDGRGDA